MDVREALRWLVSIGPFLSSLQALVIISLALLAGVALCLWFWVTPIIMHPMNRSRTMIAQFDESISKGERFLLPSSRTLGIALLSLAVIISQHPDESVAGRWKYYAAAMVVVLQAAWFEVVFIFPINRAVRDMGESYDTKGLSSFSEAEEKRLRELLHGWNRRHVFRILAPLIGACIAFAALL